MTAPVLIWVDRPVRPTQAKVWGSAPMRKKTEKDGVFRNNTANLSRPAERVVAFYNQRGTTEQSAEVLHMATSMAEN